MRHFFIFDVESIGLHGEGFAVAGGVFTEMGELVGETFCYACPPGAAVGLVKDREWVKENIPPIEKTHGTPEGVRNMFWEKWLACKEEFSGITMAAECAWPVEARFLIACVNDCPLDRNWEGPYPLHDIASFMEAAGMNPMDTYERTGEELPKHHPRADVMQSARLLATAFYKLAE